MSVKMSKKLIEVALPLDDINEAAAREKSIRHGHPSTLHLWWARRPLAAARAVLFAQMVNDPGGERGYYAGKTKQQANQEREKLFGIIRDLVKWENTNNEQVLGRARAEIMKSWRDTCELNKGKPGFDPDFLPAFHDPFAGGGTIPLEAQRLGLESFASDLNPVAVLINKAMIEIPPRFAGRKPVGPALVTKRQGDLAENWSGSRGMAEDVRRYGAWMREEAFKRIGHLYPKVNLPKERGGGEATAIAGLWARTVKSPNPAFSHMDVPLVSTFILSSKPGKEIYAHAVVDGENYRFDVRVEKPANAKTGTKVPGRGSNFLCLLSGTPIESSYIKAEGMAGRMGTRLMAVVAEGPRNRIYLSPTSEMEAVAHNIQPNFVPDVLMPENPRWFSPPFYGLTKYGDIFTQRQLVAITTFSDLIQEVRDKIATEAIASGFSDDGVGLDAGGGGATAYADAVCVYLAFAISKLADRGSSICTWSTVRDSTRNTFARQSIPMTWDFAELNTLLDGTGSFIGAVQWTAESMEGAGCHYAISQGHATQLNASEQNLSASKVISTDPPYYDNIGYADLSDFFYIWLRRSLRRIFPDLFATMAVPKSEELVATPYRHGGKAAAEKFFLSGMTEAMHRLADHSHPAFPTTIYYAFKQSDTSSESVTTNTGWETFLESVILAGFYITGTWPMRTERDGRTVGLDANALASCIVLVCRKREPDAARLMPLTH